MNSRSQQITELMVSTNLSKRKSEELWEEHDHRPLSLFITFSFFNWVISSKVIVLPFYTFYIFIPFCMPEIFQNSIEKNGWEQSEDHYNLDVRGVSITTK